MISKECLDVRVWSGVLAELMLPVQTERHQKERNKAQLASPFACTKCASGSIVRLVGITSREIAIVAGYDLTIRKKDGICYNISI